MCTQTHHHDCMFNIDYFAFWLGIDIKWSLWSKGIILPQLFKYDKLSVTILPYIPFHCKIETSCAKIWWFQIHCIKSEIHTSTSNQSPKHGCHAVLRTEWIEQKFVHKTALPPPPPPLICLKRENCCKPQKDNVTWSATWVLP